MSDHKVEVVPITVEPHHNADALEIAHVGHYMSIVRKGQFKTGDLVAYIPEQSLLPDILIKELGLEGRLAGKAQNRVKAVRLRGVLSQGLCYPARPGWVEGQVVTDELGVVKYVPPVPAHLSGEVYAAGQDKCLKYDIENIKRYPHILQEGEEVVMTEKIHGTWCMVGVMPPSMAHPEYGDLVVSSKGMSAQGLAFKPDAEANATNLYLRAARAHGLSEKLRREYAGYLGDGFPVYILGEVYGIQDLKYGASSASDETLGFRAFDIFVGRPGAPGAVYMSEVDLAPNLRWMKVERCPVLYRGPFSWEVLHQHTNGVETVSGKELHTREGVVVRPVIERRHDEIGRVQLKSVSEKYLLRKGGTEFN